MMWSARFNKSPGRFGATMIGLLLCIGFVAASADQTVAGHSDAGTFVTTDRSNASSSPTEATSNASFGADESESQRRHLTAALGTSVPGHDQSPNEHFELEQFLSRLGGGRRHAEQLLSEIWLNKATLNTCIGCKLLVHHARRNADKSEQAVHNLVETLCRVTRVDVVDGQEFCGGIADLFAGPIRDILLSTKLNEQQICAQLLHGCALKGQYLLAPLFWQIPLPAAKAAPKKTPYSSYGKADYADYSPYGSSSSSHKSGYAHYENVAKPLDRFEGGRFLHLTDAHLDAMYREGALAHCGRVHCCTARPDLKKVYQAEPSYDIDPSTAYFRRHVRTLGSHAEVDVNRFDLDLETEKPTLAGYWGSFGNCDLPIHTFRHMLRFVANEKLKNIDYVVYTGDSVASNIWSITPNQVHMTQFTLVQLIKKHLVDLPSSIASPTSSYTAARPPKYGGRPTPYLPAPVSGNTPPYSAAAYTPTANLSYGSAKSSAPYPPTFDGTYSQSKPPPYQSQSGNQKLNTLISFLLKSINR